MRGQRRRREGSRKQREEGDVECWELTGRGNLRQTGNFRAQRDRRAWKDKSHGLGQAREEALIATAALSQGFTKRQPDFC